MSLNIKSERVHTLAREAASRTGKSQTRVIEEALTNLLLDLERDAPNDRVKAAQDIVTDFQSRLSDRDRACMSTEGLYDDRGLPA